jgi:hypothetical protein
VLTYQVRKRVFRLEDPAAVVFPNNVIISFVFKPLQPFGMCASGGRTTVHSKPATVKYNPNTGMFSIESSNPLEKLEVVIQHENLSVNLKGNIFTIETEVKTIHQLAELVSSFFYAFPALLNIELADPPYIEEVYGKVGKSKFRWELEKAKFPFEITDQYRQEKKIVDSWQRIPILNDPKNRRLIGALAYFHTACRLSRCGCSPWEFMSEIIMNLAKILETLFPSNSVGKTIDSTREGLRHLGYSNEVIESSFIPVMALRNYIDVGHPFLSILKRHQLNTIYLFTENVEDLFRELLQRIFLAIDSGTYKLKEYDELAPKKDVLKIIKRMSDQLEKLIRKT